ncbi:MAG: FtsX-like permease family protein [Melioribacteraceae bacterium]|nr:MAG: FtsX-like permease family protein [Melioribacteraceae bacterium]
MFRSYFKIAYRNITKQKAFSFINISGLAIGMACCLLILLYIQDELSYDSYHSKADRIYRAIEEVKFDGVGENSASMPFPFGPTVPTDFPDMVETSVRFFNFQAPTLLLEYGTNGEKRFNETRVFCVDSTVFQVFDYEIIKGDANSALNGPNKIVFTESMVEKYFGSEDPIGKTVRFENFVDCEVTAVMKDVPHNSHLQFDFLISFSTLPAFFGQQFLTTNWYWNPNWTYILLKENVQPSSLEEQFPSLVKKYFPNVIIDKTTISLQPLKDIHLHSHLDYEISPNSDISYIYIFSAVAVFVLLIACINFVNLTTARSTNRAKEVGMRKVLGAYKNQLVQQFLGESILLCFISAVAAIILVLISIPFFNNFAEKNIPINIFANIELLAGIILISLAVGFISGIYPAFYLSAFQPVKVLKGFLKTGKKGSFFRKFMVITQFSISVILIVGTVVAFNQVQYLRNKKLGFDKEQVIMLQAFRSNLAQWFETFRTKLSQNSRILNTTTMEDVIGSKYQSGTYIPEGSADNRQLQIPRLFVNFDFTETFDINILAGRTFSREFPADSGQTVLINKECATMFGWTPEEAVTKNINSFNQTLRVIGVVDNFNFASLHNPVSPFILQLPQGQFGYNFFSRYLAIKVSPGNVESVISFLKDTWEQTVPGRAFEFFFLDDELNKLYTAEERMGKVISVFSLFAILIACLGLFALASHIAEKRTKEIGIRKVLGSSEASIIKLLSIEFLQLIIIANLIAWPISYFALNNWLQNFAYRTSIEWWIFILAGIIAVTIALLTVSFQAYKAAILNPVECLRSE